MTKLKVTNTKAGTVHEHENTNHAWGDLACEIKSDLVRGDTERLLDVTAVRDEPLVFRIAVFEKVEDERVDDIPVIFAKDLPAPEPDEKCGVCGNPLEYHNNTYRWCKNMHSFRYFQNPHTTAPECDCDCLSCNPDMYISCERRINPDRPRYTVEQIADIDKQIRKAAKVARGQVLDKIMWYMANHGVEKRPEGYYVVSGTFSLGGFIKHIESLRSQKEPQQ